MHAVIRKDEDHAFDDVSEKSGKNVEHFIVKNPLWPVPSQGIVEQAKKKMAKLKPHRGRMGWPKGLTNDEALLKALSHLDDLANVFNE